MHEFIPKGRGGQAFSATDRVSGARRSEVGQRASAAAGRLPFPDYHAIRVLNRHRAEWFGLEAVLDEVRSDAAVEADLTSDRLQVSAAIEEVGGRFVVRERPGRLERGYDDGPLSILPAGSPARGSGRPLPFLRLLILRIDEDAFDEFFEGRTRATVPPRLMFTDPTLLRLCHLLADVCSNDEGDNFYAECIAAAFLARISSFDDAPARSRSGGAMVDWQLRRTLDYLRSHLAESVSLQTLADLTRQSRSYFCRSFKASTGLSPHQWLLHARIEEAKQLLLHASQSLSEIALAVGFTDQAHFGRTFRRVAGASPGAWRRSRCETEHAIASETCRTQIKRALMLQSGIHADAIKVLSN